VLAAAHELLLLCGCADADEDASHGWDDDSGRGATSLLSKLLGRLDGSPVLAPARRGLAAAQTHLLLQALACLRLARCQQPDQALEALADRLMGWCTAAGCGPEARALPADAAALRVRAGALAARLPFALLAAGGAELRACYGLASGPAELLVSAERRIGGGAVAYLPASFALHRFADRLAGIGDSLGPARAAGQLQAADVQAVMRMTAAALAVSRLPVIGGSSISSGATGNSFEDSPDVREAAQAEAAGAVAAALDAFKAATLHAADVLTERRPGMAPAGSRLRECSERLQKEVLRAEVASIEAAFAAHVSAAPEQRQRQLAAAPLWRAAGGGERLAVGGMEPAWEELRLGDVQRLPQVGAAG
jgi:hypothetical protein